MKVITQSEYAGYQSGRFGSFYSLLKGNNIKYLKPSVKIRYEEIKKER
jgi:hypothetical protein